MEKILGLDLGTNSIGWAIRDLYSDKNQIIDKGVLTFEKGVGQGKSGEFPMVQKRTESRHKRRNYQAEKYRKYSLLECLIENNMCPLSIEELNEWRHYKKGVGRKYPQSEKFIQWLRFDFDGNGKPDFEKFGFDKHENYYLFRMLAVSEEKNHQEIFTSNPEILGRVFYHLVQRRGFKGRDEEEAATMLKGSDKTGTKGRNDIANDIEMHKTLGATLYYLCKEKNERIRKRYNLRTDFENELKIICQVQNIDDAIYKKLWKSIIWQRPLRSQKGLVGICTFERNKARCPISHPLYEEFRTWVFINNLKIELPEGVEKQNIIANKIYPLFYVAGNDFKISSITKQLKKEKGNIRAKFGDDTKVVSCKLLNSFESLLGVDWKEKYEWNTALTNQTKKCEYSYEDIWHVLFSFDDIEKLKEFAINKLKLDEDQAIKFSKIKLQQGYATLSLSAIKKLLPYLQKGFLYSHAVYMANLPKVFGSEEINENLINGFATMVDDIKKENDQEKLLNGIVNDLIRIELSRVPQEKYRIENDRDLDNEEKSLIKQKIEATYGIKTWSEKTVEEKQTAIEYCEINFKKFLQSPMTGKKDELFLAVPNLHQRIFKHLQETYEIGDDRKKYLWHPSEQETYPNAKEKNNIKQLGDPQPISNGFKNPMALKTLHKLKQLINYLLQVGKIDESTRIVIEIARELNDANKRKAIEKWQRDREKENEDFKKRIDEINKECNANYDREDKTLIDKIRLWKEQDMQCLYTGNTISMLDIFNGMQYDFEHTIPASMSFDNELKNLTIADSTYNREIKKKNIPFDLPNYSKTVTINRVEYTAIEPRLQFIKDKVEQLEKLHDEWKFKSKFASTKEIKDAIIQRKHIIRFELDYWRKKLDTFTCKEYKVGWRNSQLRDTQIVTKYALPYLKTIFRKTEVQKGSTTAAFREIYKIQPRLESKNRDKHSHHAIDAAVLTLIPSATIRDKIMLAYNEQKDNKTGLVYHEKPRGWNDFEVHHILSIEEDVAINFQAEHRTLTETKKNVRKRGIQQFVKYKDANGKWHFKLDTDGKKIPLVAKGDTIRGQLHKESFFGAIKLKGELTLVERYPIATFTNMNDCKNIVDDTVREIVQAVLDERMKSGESFDKAKLEPIPFPSGKAVIKKVRCKVAAGRGYLTPEKALPISKHDFLNLKHEYKHHLYAQNEENNLCLYYEETNETKTERAFKIVGLFELSKLKLKNFDAIKKEPFYQTVQIGNGKNRKTISINHVLKVGSKVIFYKEHIEELKGLSKTDIFKRLYRIYKYNEPAPSTVYVYFQNHLEARINDELGNGEKEVIFEKYQPRIFLSSSKFQCAIEGKHFEIKPDGEINWKF